MRQPISILLLLVAAGMMMGKDSFGQNNTPKTDAGKWKLVWADEFKKDGPPDPKNWIFEQGFVRNEEFQWYQPENAVCRKGKLIIEARREKKPNPHFEKGSADWRKNRESVDYTSACLKTEGLHAWQYGRFEMRAKIDTRSGMWPAFWTIGVEGEWPAGGEIDIMEYYRGSLLANFVWGTDRRWVGKWNSSTHPLAKFNDPRWSEKFHTWRMDWNESEIRLYVDDQLLNSVSVGETINGDGSGKNPFKQPHYILLNLAIGGQNGGDPTQTAFPARFEVDYVRVYQKE